MQLVYLHVVYFQYLTLERGSKQQARLSLPSFLLHWDPEAWEPCFPPDGGVPGNLISRCSLSFILFRSIYVMLFPLLPDYSHYIQMSRPIIPRRLFRTTMNFTHFD